MAVALSKVFISSKYNVANKEYTYKDAAGATFNIKAGETGYSSLSAIQPMLLESIATIVMADAKTSLTANDVNRIPPFDNTYTVNVLGNYDDPFDGTMAAVPAKNTLVINGSDAEINTIVNFRDFLNVELNNVSLAEEKEDYIPAVTFSKNDTVKTSIKNNVTTTTYQKNGKITLKNSDLGDSTITNYLNVNMTNSTAGELTISSLVKDVDGVKTYNASGSVNIKLDKNFAAANITEFSVGAITGYKSVTVAGFGEERVTVKNDIVGGDDLAGVARSAGSVKLSIADAQDINNFTSVTLDSATAGEINKGKDYYTDKTAKNITTRTYQKDGSVSAKNSEITGAITNYLNVTLTNSTAQGITRDSLVKTVDGTATYNAAGSVNIKLDKNFAAANIADFSVGAITGYKSVTVAGFGEERVTVRNDIVGGDDLAGVARSAGSVKISKADAQGINNFTSVTLDSATVGEIDKGTDYYTEKTAKEITTITYQKDGSVSAKNSEITGAITNYLNVTLTNSTAKNITRNSLAKTVDSIQTFTAAGSVNIKLDKNYAAAGIEDFSAGEISGYKTVTIAGFDAERVKVSSIEGGDKIDQLTRSAGSVKIAKADAGNIRNYTTVTLDSAKVGEINKGDDYYTEKTAKGITTITYQKNGSVSAKNSIIGGDVTNYLNVTLTNSTARDIVRDTLAKTVDGAETRTAAGSVNIKLDKNFAAAGIEDFSVGEITGYKTVTITGYGDTIVTVDGDITTATFSDTRTGSIKLTGAVVTGTICNYSSITVSGTGNAIAAFENCGSLTVNAKATLHVEMLTFSANGGVKVDGVDTLNVGNIVKKSKLNGKSTCADVFAQLSAERLEFDDAGLINFKDADLAEIDFWYTDANSSIALDGSKENFFTGDTLYIMDFDGETKTLFASENGFGGFDTLEDVYCMGEKLSYSDGSYISANYELKQEDNKIIISTIA